MFCKRLNRGTHPHGVWMTCTAFPNGIPEAIIESRADHRQPVSGDHGQQWLPDDEHKPVQSYSEYFAMKFPPATASSPS
jgi:hypothetical protein